MSKTTRLAGALVAALLAPQLQAHASSNFELEPVAPTVAAPAPQESASDEDADILTRIRALPGVVSAVELRSLPGARFFSIEFDQPVDHQQPQGRRFLQRVTLLHRAEARPMVLASTGYGISIRASQRELTYLLQANQLTVEHRFFGPSTPQPTTWEHLTIAQAAGDHHRLAEAFKALYGAKWVSTGASKGGMTSVYHRFFYPGDVDATVPYVAPSSQGPYDARYVKFVAEAGSDPACNEKLSTFQKAALLRRAELLPLVSAAYEPLGITFNLLGLERSFEFAVVELPFAFWQYGAQPLCAFIPAADAPAAELFDFLEYVVGVGYLAGDGFITYYAPYYYQAATQLGAPRVDERHLHGMLRYPRQDVVFNYPPYDVEKPFDPSIMNQVERWVLNEGQRFLFIYGGNDPWSTGAFDVRERNDAFRLWVPEGNHGSSILALPEAERTLALDKIEAWMGVPVLRPGALRAMEGGELPFDPPSREELFLR
ncbi:MAG: hypothetical protein JXB05_13225 [Myxococcaceae bacterium]|nr:hypothetical protein [Myxococcaceae bacterium]